MLVYKFTITNYILMDDKNSLKNGELEKLALEDSFLFELASFFANKQMPRLLELPRVISLYNLGDKNEPILKKFKFYLTLELYKKYRENRPRVVISRDEEVNTYSIPVDFFLNRRKMTLPPTEISSRATESYIYPESNPDS